MWTRVVVAVLSVLAAGRAEFPDDQECPEDCDCHYFRVNYVTDCSESNFTEIPYEELSPNVYILDLNGRYCSAALHGRVFFRLLQVMRYRK